MPIMTSIPPKTADPPVKKNAFVHKLYSMLSNPKLAHLIWWTDTPEANTFALYPSKEFADALSGYFKHGNVASFVRQLHMYGFHKVLEPQTLVLNVKDSPIWEFRHSSGKFKKNDEKSLVYIKRRLLLNLLRNMVVENDQPRPTLTPPPQSYDHHYQQASAHYPPSVSAVPGAIPSYGPVAHYAPLSSGYHTYVAASPSAAVHGGQLAMVATGQSPAAVSARTSHPPPPHGSTHSSLASHGGSHLGSLHFSQPATFQAHYHTHRMMLPPPPPALLDGRMYQVQWQQGTPVYSQYYPLLTTPGAEEARASQDGAALTFRKPWEQQAVEKSRNPSLLYDPLAPAASSADANHASPAVNSVTNSPRSEVIKLPPLGRSSLPTVGNLPLKLAASTPGLKSSSSIPSAHPVDLSHPSLPPTLMPHNLLPSQLWSGKASQIPVNKSIIDKLRPSLIELHFPHAAGSLSTPSSISGKHMGASDSIGSYSLSVFSGVSSILSYSSGRTSSFGSVSHIVLGDKNKSIGPHEQPVSPQLRSACLPSVTTIKEENSFTYTDGKSDSDTPADASKPSTPLHKSKVEFLLDASDSKDDQLNKRRKVETSE